MPRLTARTRGSCHYTLIIRICGLVAFSAVLVPIIAIHPQGSASVPDAALALPDSIGSRQEHLMVCIAPKLRDGLAGCLQGTFGRNWSVRYSRFLLWRRLCFLWCGRHLSRFCDSLRTFTITLLCWGKTRRSSQTALSFLHIRIAAPNNGRVVHTRQRTPGQRLRARQSDRMPQAQWPLRRSRRRAAQASGLPGAKHLPG